MNDRYNLDEPAAKKPEPGQVNEIRQNGCGCFIAIVIFIFMWVMAFFYDHRTGFRTLSLLSEIAKFAGSLIGARCDATGVGFPGLFLLPLLFIRNRK
ncbi:MAG: hypothetical protein FWF87_02330 [Synergistaceae bacterium]|nr:hypothetical protein [Synergistaceae bacterium]